MIGVNHDLIVGYFLNHNNTWATNGVSLKDIACCDREIAKHAAINGLHHVWVVLTKSILSCYFEHKLVTLFMAIQALL